MAGSYLRRLEAIEAALRPAAMLPMHRVVVEVGQTEEEAVAAYAAMCSVDAAEVERNGVYRVIGRPERG